MKLINTLEKHWLLNTFECVSGSTPSSLITLSAYDFFLRLLCDRRSGERLRWWPSEVSSWRRKGLFDLLNVISKRERGFADWSCMAIRHQFSVRIAAQCWCECGKAEWAVGRGRNQKFVERVKCYQRESELFTNRFVFQFSVQLMLKINCDDRTNSKASTSQIINAIKRVFRIVLSLGYFHVEK
jgi:hypothetical protein